MRTSTSAPELLTTLQKAFQGALPQLPRSGAARTLATQSLLVALGVRCAHLVDVFAPSLSDVAVLADVLGRVFEDIVGGGELAVLVLSYSPVSVPKGEKGTSDEDADEASQDGKPLLHQVQPLQVFVVNTRLIKELLPLHEARSAQDRIATTTTLVVDATHGSRPSILTQVPRQVSEAIKILSKEASRSERTSSSVPIWILSPSPLGPSSRGQDAQQPSANSTSSSSSASAQFRKTSISLAGWLLEYACMYSFRDGDIGQDTQNICERTPPTHTSTGSLQLHKFTAQDIHSALKVKAARRKKLEGDSSSAGDDEEFEEEPMRNNLGDEELVLFQVSLASPIDQGGKRGKRARQGHMDGQIALLAFTIPVICLDRESMAVADSEAAEHTEGEQGAAITEVRAALQGKFTRRLEESAKRLSDGREQDAAVRGWLENLQVEVKISRHSLGLIAL